MNLNELGYKGALDIDAALYEKLQICLNCLNILKL